MENNKEKINKDEARQDDAKSFSSPFLQNENIKNDNLNGKDRNMNSVLFSQEQPSETGFSPMGERGKIKKMILRSLIILISLIIIAVVAGIGLRVFRSYMQLKSDNKKLEEKISMEVNKAESIDENIIKSEVITEESAVVDDNVVLSSENYRIRKINIGGDIVIMADNSENKPLEINSVRNEMFMTRDSKDVKLLIYWKTNKLTISEITYEELGGGNKRVKIEEDFDVNHSVVLSDLAMNTTYVYKVKAKDRWGNEVVSSQYSVNTGALPVSIFDLIGREFGEIFKWTIRK